MITFMSLLLIGAFVVAAGVLRFRLGRGAISRGPTWGCGYAAPSARMQYTASSFAATLVGLFGWALRPRTHRPEALPLFPGRAEFHSQVPDTVLDGVVVPTLGFAARLCAMLRVFQQGNIQIYLLYIFVALVVLLLWP
jgi:hypothetical protein